jgi:serine protease Do
VFGLTVAALLEVFESRWLVYSEGNIEVDTRPPGNRFRGLRGLLSRARNSRATQVGKNHELVKSAFRDATASANEATVQVLSGTRQLALGTVIAADGYVVTKASVIRKVAEIAVVFSDGNRKSASVVATDEDLDLALLKVNGSKLPAANLARTASLPIPIGSWVAVTSGTGELPLVVGVISGISRDIRRDDAVLGVLIENASPGPKIQIVVPGSSAAQIGLQSGDIVTHVNGKAMKTRDELIQHIRRYRPGDAVKLDILRDNEPLDLSAKLGRSTELFASEHGARQHAGGPLSVRRSGFPRVIQHDCLLYPKNCGGPLVDLDGEVIGINIARAGRAESFALPADVVQEWAAPLMQRLPSGPPPR